MRTSTLKAAINKLSYELAAFLLMTVSLSAASQTPARSASQLQQNTVIEYDYQIIDRFPHDIDAFTQGLEIVNGRLYESAGKRGKSRLFIRSIDELKPLKSHSLKPQYFAEGLTVYKDRVYQLTWQSGKGFIYDAKSLQPLAEFPINGQGWGLCHNEQWLIMSDGTANLKFINPKTFVTERTIQVTFEGQAVDKINELEWVNGLIYANIWQSNWMVMIDPQSGRILGKVDLSNLLPKSQWKHSTDVINGIAFDNAGQRLLVTGKNWPTMFHIELKARPDE